MAEIVPREEVRNRTKVEGDEGKIGRREREANGGEKRRT